MSTIKKIALVSLLLASNLFVVSATSTPLDTFSSEVIATVDIKNAKITSQTGNTFVIDFDISNEVGVQPGVRYAAYLTKEKTGTVTTVDEKVYNDLFSIGENTTIHKTITYTPSESLSGIYYLKLLSKTSGGVPLAFKVLGAVTLEESKIGSVSINPATCRIVNSGEKNSSYKLNGFPLLSASDSLTLTCDVHNTTKNKATLTSGVIQYRGGSFGEIVQGSSSSTEVIVPANGTKSFTVAIPRVTKPQSYQAEVSFKDENSARETNTVAFRYYLEGINGKIHTVLLDKDRYEKGDTAVVSFTWSLSGTSFPEVKDAQGVSLAPLSAIVTIVNGDKVPCALETVYPLISGSSLVKVPVSLINRCYNPEVTLRVVDKNQQDMDMQSFSIISNVKPDSKNTSSKNYPLVVVIFGATVGIIMLLSRKMLFKSAASPIAALFLALSFIGGIQHAEMTTVWLNCRPSICGSPNAATIFINSSLGSGTYAPGQSIEVMYLADSDDHPVSACLSARANVNSGSYGSSGLGGCYSAYFTEEGSSIAGTAPSSAGPGTVNVSLAAGSNYTPKSDSLGFTVVVPPTPSVNINFSSLMDRTKLFTVNVLKTFVNTVFADTVR